MAKELRAERILFLSSATWNGLCTRKQLMARRLACRNRVMYVEPQLSAAYLARTRRAFPIRGRGPFRDGNVSVLSPPPALPIYTRSRIVHGVSLHFLRRRLQAALSAVGWEPSILWFYDPTLAGLRRAWPCAGVVYDCVDRHDAYPGRGRLVPDLQSDLVRSSSVVVVTSEALVRDFASLRKDVAVVPNGVDLSLFDKPSPLPPGSVPSGRVLIGFVGGIGEWVDLGLLQSLAAQRRDWCLCLAGPVASGVVVDRLAREPNVQLLGRIVREQVPSFIRAMDVCILPFTVNRLTAAVNPLKLFEYFAAGKPVVSTPLEEVERFTPLVRIARDAGEFVEAIAQSLSNCDDLHDARRAVAEDHSWSVLLPRLEAVMAAGLAVSG